MNNNLKFKVNYLIDNKCENLFKYEEYYLSKGNKKYKILIRNNINEIIIESDNYEKKINNNNLSILVNNIGLNTINELYNIIINLFKDKKVIIKDIFIEKEMSLLFKANNFNNEEFEIILINKNFIFNKKINNIINPIDIKFNYTLVTDSYSYYSFLDNTFNIFESIENIIYLIYTNENKSIISYNIIDNKRINEIKNAHNEYITNFRYYLDKTNKKDLIISISAYDNNIKLWNINNLECLLNLKDIYEYGFLYSACFLKDNGNNESYIITSNYNYSDNCELIKVFDFNGKKVKEINDTNDKTYFIDTYNDNQLSIIFIITGNKNDIKAYDYFKNEIYHKYDDNNNKGHYSTIIYNDENIIKLIELSDDKNIRIWNFHTGKLLKKIRVSNNYSINGLCLWNNKYLFVGCYDKEIKLIELSNGNIIKHLISHEKRVLTIKKIYHIKYGYCLISQGYDKKIKLWINKK